MASPIPKSMYAWRKHRGNSEPVWEEIPVPETPVDGLLCKVIAAGVCHSDHSLLTRDTQSAWFQEKYTLGHEGCGEIVQIGSLVKGSDFHIVSISSLSDHRHVLTEVAKGDKVALFSVPGCGDVECSECSRGLSQLCQRGWHSGIGQDGFYATYAAISVRGAVHLPEGVTPAVAAVATDAVTTAYHAITRRGEVKSHETVFLFGLGGLGFNALQIIRSIGARVIVSDIREERLEAAVNLGVPREDLVPLGTSVQVFIKENGLQESIDTVFDFVGTQQTFEDAHHIVRLAGKIVCVGTFSPENTVHMKIGTRKRLSFLFSYGGQVGDLRKVLELISQKIIQPQVETAKLEEFPRMLQDLCEGRIKGRVALLPD